MITPPFILQKCFILTNKTLGRKIWKSLEGILLYGSYSNKVLDQLIPSGTKSGNFLGIQILGMATHPIHSTELWKNLQERPFYFHFPS